MSILRKIQHTEMLWLLLILYSHKNIFAQVNFLSRTKLPVNATFSVTSDLRPIGDIVRGLVNWSIDW